MFWFVRKQEKNAKPRIGLSLGALVLAAVLPILIFGVGVGWLVVNKEEAAVASELTSTTRALMVAVERELQNQFAAMEVLLTDVSLDAGNIAAFGDRTRRALKVNPSWRNAVLIDPQTHTIIASGLPMPYLGLTAASPAAVNEVTKTRKSKIVGVFAAGKIVDGPIIQFLAPVIRDNEVRYVLSVVMSPTTLNDIFVEQRLAASWTGAILDSHLAIAGRSRDSKRFIGVKATPTLADHITASDKGMFTALNQEGDSVYTAFSKSQSTGWSVAIGVPAAEVEGPIRRILTQLAATGGTLIAFALILTGIVGRAIVRRRNAYEKSLVESESRLNLALSGADMATWDWHISDGTLVLNARGAEILGYTLDELPPRIESWETRIHPDDRPTVQDKLDLHFNGTKPVYESEHRVRRKDGQWIWLYVRGRVFEWDKTGNPLSFMGTALDITERKSIEQVAEMNRVRLQTILSTVNDGIHILDNDGILIDANKSFLSMLRCDESVIGRLHVTDWDAVNTAEELEKRHEKLVAQGGQMTFETRHRRRDGSLLDVEVGLSVFEFDGQQYVCAASRDITERKLVEASREQRRQYLEEQVQARTLDLSLAKQAAEAANRAKTAFLANMSHELRTPLNGIMGMTAVALRSTDDSRLKDYLTKVLLSSERLHGLINNILDIVWIESERFDLRPTDFELHGVLEKLTHQQGSIARKKGLVFAIDVAADLERRPLNGDALRLGQLLAHLTNNAVRFTDNGTVIVRITVAEETPAEVLVRFEIRDTGIGISAEHQKRLFTAFEQADTSMTRKYNGTGLGLTLSKRLAQAMGGSIGVESRLGGGSTFWFTVRLAKIALLVDAEPLKAPRTAEETLVASYSGARILLAEDEPFNQEVTKILMEEVGLRVDVANDGAEAVEMSKETDYDLILMDLRMPVLNGVEATRQIRKLSGRSETPILALTASVFTKDSETCFAAGMNDFIGKPIKPESLFGILLKWLEKSQ